MSYFNVGEVYVSGTNRIPGSKEDMRPMNDNYCQIIEVTEIVVDSIDFDVIASHPDCTIDSSTMPNMFYDSTGNTEFFKKLNNPILLS